MKNSKDIFGAALGQTVRNAPVFNKTPVETKRRFYFAIIQLFLFMGSEFVLVLFRKNVGSKAIHVPALIIFLVCLLAISALMLCGYYSSGNFDDSIGSQQSYLVTSIVFFALTVIILIKFIIFYSKPITLLTDSESTGDSALLGFLAKDNWKPENIKLIAEPVLLLSVGISYCFYNLFGGIVFIFCAISVWGRILMELYYLKNDVQNNVNSQSTNKKNNKSYVN